MKEQKQAAHVNKRFIWIMVFILIFGFGITAVGRIPSRFTTEEPGTQEAPAPVLVQPVGFHRFEEKVTGVAFLQAKEFCLLSSRASGNVIRVLRGMGAGVKKGDVLCRLDPTHYELSVRQARAALHSAEASLADLIAWSRPEDIAALEAKAAQAEAQLADAERNFKRLQSLYKEKAVSESQYESVKAGYKAALYGFQAAEENLRKARAGPTPTAVDLAKSQVRQAKESLAQAEQNLRDTVVRAPMDGVVVMRHVELGQTVTPGMVLFKIVNNHQLTADVNISEREWGLIRVGMKSDVEVDALKGQVFSGNVCAVNAMVNPEVHTFTVRVEIDNPGEKMMDGMFCRVDFNTGEYVKLAVPRAALLHSTDTGSDEVFLVREGKAEKKRIQTGARHDVYVEVLEGLVEGDRVVTNGFGRIWHGRAVTIQEQGKNSHSISRRGEDAAS